MVKTFYCERLRQWGTSPEQCIRRQEAKGPQGSFKFSQCQDCAQGKFVRDQNPEAVKLAKVPLVPRAKGPAPRRVIDETHYHRTLDFGEDGDKPYSQIKKERAEMKRPRECEKCGKTYTPAGNRQKFCDACRGNATPGKKAGSGYREKVCAECGDQFKPAGARSRICNKCKSDHRHNKPEVKTPPPAALPVEGSSPPAPALVPGNDQGVSVSKDDPLMVTVDLRKYPGILRCVVAETTHRVLTEAEARIARGDG